MKTKQIITPAFLKNIDNRLKLLHPFYSRGLRPSVSLDLSRQNGSLKLDARAQLRCGIYPPLENVEELLFVPFKTFKKAITKVREEMDSKEVPYIEQIQEILSSPEGKKVAEQFATIDPDCSLSLAFSDSFKDKMQKLIRRSDGSVDLRDVYKRLMFHAGLL